MHVEGNVPDNQTVAVGKLANASDWSIVDERPVLASQIADADVAVQLVDQNFAVMAADELLRQLNVAVGGPADQVFRFDQQVLRRFDDEWVAIDAVCPFKNDLHCRLPDILPFHRSPLALGE